MRSKATHAELDSLVAKFDAAGGVLDYVFLERGDTASHRDAAIAGMAEIDRHLEQWAVQKSSAEYPIEMFFRVRCDETKLTGEPASFAKFWGTDDVEPKPIGDRAWSIPNVDGYKTAFFHPPYGLHGSPSEKNELFGSINRFVLGIKPERAEIYSWSTDWSNYFEAGHEWWGAFYWTIRPADSEYIVVVAASSTD